MRKELDRACLKTLPCLRLVVVGYGTLVSTSMCHKHISVSDSAPRSHNHQGSTREPRFSGKL